MLCFHPRISPFQTTISYRLLPPHSILCCLRKLRKLLKSGGKTYDQYEKAHYRRTDGSHPRSRPYTPVIATEAPAIRVSSYKGNTLEVGERSGLIIGPSGTEYTASNRARGAREQNTNA